MVTTTYGTVEVDGAKVFYREAGDPTAPTLLLLPGFPSSSAQYQGLIDLLGEHHHLVSPDYPGFGRSPALEGETTFDRVADAIERFTEVKQLDRHALYMFDFGSPVGFRVATRHPEQVSGLVMQNGNAYLEGLGPKMQALAPYWRDRAANEAAVRGALEPEAVRSQYVDGVPDPDHVNPDLWELDLRYIGLPGRDRVMLDLLYDYQNNLPLYPEWQKYLRDRQPPTLLAWGKNDEFFPVEGAEAYKKDLPDAQLHLLDTGHFATATHSPEIAELIAEFIAGRAAVA
ncbi:MAG TPA: alpha/beta hydrolase [Conexibacter sp.]|jgi:pimeloyl-ACP methyl ester carboxylesterase